MRIVSFGIRAKLSIVPTILFLGWNSVLQLYLRLRLRLEGVWSLVEESTIEDLKKLEEDKVEHSYFQGREYLKRQEFDSKGEERERVKVFVKGKLLKGVSLKGQEQGGPPDFKFQGIEGAAGSPLGEQKCASPNQSAPHPLGRLLAELATHLRELLEHSAEPSLGRQVPLAHRQTTTPITEFPYPFAEFGIIEAGGETQAPIGETTLAILLDVLNNVRGDIARMDSRLATVEGRVNSNDSTPQATFRASTSEHDHTNSLNFTPGTLHQALHPTFNQLVKKLHQLKVIITKHHLTKIFPTKYHNQNQIP
ncbi:hypothetical protein KY285_016488 [Solanum tuberosum]|nr:hypothetical protein KY285_016488 [Solanum tuberosum]